MSVLDHFLNHLQEPISPIIDFDGALEDIGLLDLSPANVHFSERDYASTEALTAFIASEKKRSGATILMGGYNETRNMYRRSHLFDQNLNAASTAEEPRNIHLGIDIWAEEGTKVYAPLAGKIHSFAHNNHFGDYGPTIILEHRFSDTHFYSLYGHLSVSDLEGLYEGKPIGAGTVLAHFGPAQENGNWPPHLHFQIILNLQGFKGDYPGVCKESESAFYLQNCPDPRVLVNF